MHNKIVFRAFGNMGVIVGLAKSNYPFILSKKKKKKKTISQAGHHDEHKN